MRANSKQKLTGMAETKRFTVPDLGEWYTDQLALDAWINNRSKAVQAQSLLCAKLQEREPTIEKRLTYIAQKRGLTLDELRSQILAGKAQQLSRDEDGE
ncbi:hypothetical protein [Allocoleopsis sp.]|uniref:hypothetical protein n=1 Tax=Allocoleopsis sp. TaxID=3088169 RepID=UPI002FD73F5B